MSLVNKMLRDLDARRAGAAERSGLPDAVTPLGAADAPSGSTARRIGLALFAIAGLAAAAWVQFGMPPRQAAAPATVSAPTPAPVQVATTPEPAPVAVPPAPTSVAVAAEPALRLDVALAEPAPKPARKAEAKVADKVADKSAEKPKPAAAKARPEPPKPADEPSRIDKQALEPTVAERAEADYRAAVALQRQGQADEAAARYRSALAVQPDHAGARQALAALLIDGRRHDEAEGVLRQGIAQPATQLASALSLARLKVERRQVQAAMEVLQASEAAGDKSAEFQGFAGALLNRLGRGAEAVGRYQNAVRLQPADPRWWAGLGIALESAGRHPEARDAYQRARLLPGLPAELAQHVEARLK